MLITHTRNARVGRRIDLGAKGGLECWIEPSEGKGRWTFWWQAAVTGQPLEPQHVRSLAAHIHLQLAEALQISPANLSGVPFDSIAALRAGDPYSTHPPPHHRSRLRRDERKALKRPLMADGTSSLPRWGTTLYER